MQCIQYKRLRVQRRLCRIQIFGLCIAQGASAEGNNLAALIPDGKHEPASKAVVNFTVFVLNEKPGSKRIRRTESTQESRRRGITEPEPFDISRLDFSFLQNLSGARGIRTGKHLTEMVRRPFVNLK